MIGFILGTIFGIALTITVSTLIKNRTEYDSYVKPLDEFVELPLSEWEFVKRINQYFVVNVGKYTVYGNLDKKELTFFIGNEAKIITVDMNKRRMNHVYQKLVNGFDKEIFNDIKDLGNGLVISNNMILTDEEGKQVIETYENIPTVDEILDKINSIGIENLTQQEKDILNNMGE